MRLTCIYVPLILQNIKIVPLLFFCDIDYQAYPVWALWTSNITTEREREMFFNTFYLRLYGVRHMVKDHSDSEKGNPLPPHRLLLSINSKGSFICTIPQTG